MLLDRLERIADPVAQDLMVAMARASVRKSISEMSCPKKLLGYSERVYQISKQHPAANPLQREAQLATDKAMEISGQVEYVAQEVINAGHQAVGRISGRVEQMRKRWGDAQTLVRIVTKSAGGESWTRLVEAGKKHLTAEHFVATHCRDRVAPELLGRLDLMLEVA